jgi:acyl-CoA thioester hydrolase
VNPEPNDRKHYVHFRTQTTRWMDNDPYGHVNNVVYYSWFDSVVNQYLIAAGALDILHGPVIGLVVETHCNYFKPIAFPESVTAGLRVARIGTTSVRYEIGLFCGEDSSAAAQGHFVHVYVERKTRRPRALSPELRAAISALVLP